MTGPPKESNRCSGRRRRRRSSRFSKEQDSNGSRDSDPITHSSAHLSSSIRTPQQLHRDPGLPSSLRRRERSAVAGETYRTLRQRSRADAQGEINFLAEPHLIPRTPGSSPRVGCLTLLPSTNTASHSLAAPPVIPVLTAPPPEERSSVLGEGTVATPFRNPHATSTEERRWLSRTSLPSLKRGMRSNTTREVSSVPLQTSTDTLGATEAGPFAGDSRVESGRVASLLQRPPSPVLLPTVGRTPPPIPAAMAAAPPADVVFTDDDYVAWLRLPRTPDYGPCDTPASTSTATITATSATVTHVPNEAPSLVATPSSSQHTNISYEQLFSVHTDWQALRKAPPLTRLTPCMPSMSMQGRNRTSAAQHHIPLVGLDCDASGPPSGDMSVKGAPEEVEESAVRTVPTPPPSDASTREEGSQAALAAPTATVEVPSTSSPGPSGPPHRSHGVAHKDDDDGVTRVFVRHATHGLVFVDSPWFICSTLLDNCEHPYYATWLDEMEIRSLEETVAEARRNVEAEGRGATTTWKHDG